MPRRVRSAAVKWLAPKPIVGRPCDLEAEAVVVGQRRATDVAPWWPCSCGRMYGTYWSETVLSKRPTTRRRGGRSSSPTARGRTRSSRSSPGGSASTTPTRGTSRSSGAELDHVLDEELARCEQPVALAVHRVVPVAAARRAMHDLDPCRDADRVDAAARGGRGRARASAAARRSACSAPAAARRCRSAPARAAGAGPSTSDVPPVERSSRGRPSRGRSTARTCRRPRARRPRLGADVRAARPAARTAAAAASCCHATSWPAGAQSVARAQEEAEGDEPLAVAARQLERDVERLARRRRAAPAGARPCAARRRRSAPTRRGSGRASRSGGGCGCGSARRRDASTCTGCARNLSSCSAGCGVRSGQTIPSAQKFASCGVVAEVAAVRPVLAPARVALPDAVVDPLPDEPALERVVLLERGEVVGEPAVRVAHRVRVLAEDQRPRVVGRLAAHASIESTSAYIGQTTSVARRPAASSPA